MDKLRITASVEPAVWWFVTESLQGKAVLSASASS